MSKRDEVVESLHDSVEGMADSIMAIFDDPEHEPFRAAYQQAMDDCDQPNPEYCPEHGPAIRKYLETVIGHE